MSTLSNNVNNSIATYRTGSYEKYLGYQRFGFLYSIMKNNLPEGGEFLDIGCAKGEFIYFLKEKNCKLNFTGLEYSEELISLAKKEPRLRDVTFVQGDARDFDLNKQFDCALMAGVLSIFDDIEKPLMTMIKHIKFGGYGYIFGGFTIDDIDVIVRFRNNYAGSAIWESGLNMFSLNTVRKAIEPFCSEINFHRFNLSIDLKKQDDPIKTFTLNTKEKDRIVANGANIIREFYLVQFKRKNCL
jgi:SAM-dependent methyltransferase